MRFHICAKNELIDCMIPFNPTHVLSINDPDEPHHTLLLRNDIAVKFMHFEDIDDEKDEYGPKIHHCQEILEFGKEIPTNGRLLVHCWAGISRSTASTWAILCMRRYRYDIAECFDHVLDNRSVAWPNSTMVKHYDQLLGYNGKMIDHLAQWKHANNVYKTGRLINI